MKTILYPGIVQTGIYMLAFLGQADHLIFARLNTQQGNPHPVVHAYHYLPLANTGLYYYTCLNTFETTIRDAYPVTFTQITRFRHIHRKLIRVRTGHPTQVFHLTIGYKRI